MPDPISYDDVIDNLLERLPEFRTEVEEHVQFNDGLLPHVLFGDLTRFVFRAREQGRDDVVQRALAFLDEALRHGDEQVDNLVSVSFVENVGPWDPAQVAFIDEWPRALREEAVRQRDWRSPSE
jgi:hypothetical protein